MYDLASFRGWESPNLYVMYMACKMHREMEARYPQYKSIDGDRNIWISKPSYNARGVGIFCFNRTADVLQGAAKK